MTPSGAPPGPPEGRTLRTVLGSGLLPPGEALHVAAGVCDALESAAARGRLPRHLGPESLELLPDGRVQILESDPSDPVLAPYVAPELRGGPGTPSIPSTLYSLGVLLYELLARRLPSDPWVPPSTVAGTSLLVDQVIEKSLHPDPSRRPAGIRAFRDIVSPPPPRPASSEWSAMKIPWIAAGVLCLFVFVLMGLTGWRIKQARLAARIGTLESEPPPNAPPVGVLRLTAQGIPVGTSARSLREVIDSLPRDTSLDAEIDPEAPGTVQEDLRIASARHGVSLRFVAGDARFLRLRIARGESLRVEDYRLRLGEDGQSLAVTDRKGVHCVDFLPLRAGDPRRWMDLDLTLLEVGQGGITLQIRILPGATCFGAGNYLNLRPGLKIELSRRRRLTIETYDPATLEMQAAFEGDGMTGLRLLKPKSQTRLLGIDCRYRPDPSDPALGLILSED